MPPKQPVRTPGEEPQQDGAPEKVKAGTTELNNIVGTTANDVGADRERVVRAQAQADAARRGVEADLAPAADIGKPAEPTSTKREAIINGQKVMVELHAVRKNSAVEQFGHESKLPVGTLVNADGTAFEKTEAKLEPYGVIGHIDTAQGKLVNRVIPFDAVKSAA